MLDAGSHQMALHVVDPDERELASPGRGLGEGMPHQQRPDQPGAGGGGDAVEVGRVDPRFDQCPMGEGTYRLDMGPGSHLRHDAPESSVDFDLAGENTRKRLGPPDHRNRGLIARSLKGEHQRVHRSPEWGVARLTSHVTS